LLKYHINGVPMRKVVKRLKSMYDKGVILPNGRVKPILLNDDNGDDEGYKC